MSKIRFYSLCAALAVLGLNNLARADTPVARPEYSSVHTASVGAPERWDYLTLDPQSRRLYLAHGDRVDVLDGRSGAKVGSVPGIPGGTHGIGIVDELGKGYTDDGKAGEVVAFDLRTFKVLHRIKGEPDADGIVIDPKTQHVFVINGDSGSVTVIDPRTDKVIATVHPWRRPGVCRRGWTREDLRQWRGKARAGTNRYPDLCGRCALAHS